MEEWPPVAAQQWNIALAPGEIWAAEVEFILDDAGATCESKSLL